MIRTFVACSAVALALVSAGPMAMAQSTKSAVTGTAAAKANSADQAFIKKAIQGNLAEVKMGDLGVEKGKEADVKTFGKMLVTDHGAANDKALQAAKAAGVTPPSQPSDKQQKTYDKLSKLSGEAFDRQYAEAMVEDHKADIADYTKAAKGKGPIADYAKATLPKLHEHLQKAQALDKNETSEKSGAK